MDNKVVIKTKTVFFYLYKILNFLKQVNAYLVAGGILFVISHAGYRIYEGSNAYVDYLNNNPQQMIMLLFATICLFIGYSIDKKIKLRLGIVGIPAIFLFVTYYLSFSFSLEHYLILPTLLTSLFVLTVSEQFCKKLKYKYKIVMVVDEEHIVNGLSVKEAKLCA